MKDRSDDPSHHERTLLPRSYISFLWISEDKGIEVGGIGGGGVGVCIYIHLFTWFIDWFRIRCKCPFSSIFLFRPFICPPFRISYRKSLHGLRGGGGGGDRTMTMTFDPKIDDTSFLQRTVGKFVNDINISFLICHAPHLYDL